MVIKSVMHESRSLRQARPFGQSVDLPHSNLRKLLPQVGVLSCFVIIADFTMVSQD